MTATDIISRLVGVTRTATGWTARCPAHEDGTASLSVTEGSDGRILAHCHAGCTVQDIVAAMGITLADLFHRNDKPPRRETGKRIVATYDYHGADGSLVFQVCRMEPKSFRQRQPDGNGGWAWSMKGIARVVYHLPDVLEAVASGRVIYITEGEKDVDTLREHGLVATCNPGGAGKWEAAWGTWFAGASVYIIPDRDAPGRKHAEDVARKLHGHAASVRIVELPVRLHGRPVKDASDYLGAGGTAEGIARLAEEAPEWRHGSAQNKPVEPRQGPPEAYYDPAKKVFWIRNNRQLWIEISEGGFRRHLKASGVSPVKPEGAFVSAVDATLVQTQLERDVSYAGALAGYKTGVHDISGNRVLVTTSPRFIAPREGGFPILENILLGLFGAEQHPYFLLWWKLAIETVRSGRHRPGQAVAIAGPGGCGKSLVQNIITETLGGRSVKPFRYMYGTTDFNADLFTCEHLMIEDEVAASDIRSRRNFGSRIKEVCVNITQSCHAKGRQALTLTPVWRLTITLNSEPENLQILPPVDESIADKLMLFKGHAQEMPMPSATNEEKAAFWCAIMAELPAFVHYLEQLSIPAGMMDQRYGVRHYHHPDILGALDDMAPETRLLNLIDSELFGTPAAGTWEGTAEDLEARLVGGATGWRARKLLDWSNAVGTYLSRLETRHPDRFARHRTNSSRKWLISPTK